MNNSKIAFDNVEEIEDGSSLLERKKGELTQIVEAIKGVEANADWQKLRKLVLDGVVETLEHHIRSEATKAEINTPELYRLQGQLVWARRYGDLSKLSEFFKLQIEGIKSKLNEKIPRDGAL